MENHKVQNSTRFAQMLVTTPIRREMHGKAIATAGYKAILKMQNFSREDITAISISVQNDFGNVTKIYVINRNNNQSKLVVLENYDIDIYNIYNKTFFFWSRKCFRSTYINTIKALINTILSFKNIHVYIYLHTLRLIR